MYGHRTFLLLGGGAGDILSLIKGGHEVSRFNFSLEQGVDDKGKATTRVYAGALSITLSQLPPTDIIEWALRSRKYNEGGIVTLDANNLPVEKILFKNAACVGMDLDYTQKGQPQHEIRGGQITLVLTEVPDNNLYDWAKNSTKLKNGEIVFETEMSNAVLKILFVNAYCIKLNRDVDEFNGTKTILVIAPEKVVMNGIEHTNFWKNN